MNTPLPLLLPVSEITDRLKKIFPDTLPNRNYCVRDLAASTVFAFIYTGAGESKGIYLSPKHVYRMTEEQAGKNDDAERLSYHVRTLTPGFRIPGVPWYSDTTRESIRDETLKEGFVAFGAVGVDPSIPTTSSKPRYYFKQSFAALFSPTLTGDTLVNTINNWQQQHLSSSAMAMLAILKEDAHGENERVLITLPNSEVRAVLLVQAQVLQKLLLKSLQ